MLREIATLDEVQKISEGLIVDAIRHQLELAKNHNSQGSEVWTKAIWHSFEDLRTRLGEGWKLSPEQPPKGPGRAAGEFLVDFILIDDRLGPRVACESELGTRTKNNYDWAFAKLAGVKADIKIFLVEYPLSKDGGLPTEIDKIVRSYLSPNMHLDPREHYVVMQCDHSKWTCFHWNPPSSGPLDKSKINFLPLMHFDAGALAGEPKASSTPSNLDTIEA